MKKKTMIIIVGVLLSLCVLIVIMMGNQLFISGNSVIGVDISHYQGKVDFEKMKKENIRFVFIKATEGAKYKDEMFEENYQNAQNNEMCVGAYHFFSTKSSGKKQADNFIKTVGDLKGKLPPVVDVEVYGSDDGSYDVVNELNEYMTVIENHYGIKPIIYTTYKNYEKYVKDNFEENILWIRSVYFPATFIAKKWTFWQYSDSEKKNFYSGEEDCIDMNVFNGSIEELKNMLIK